MPSCAHCHARKGKRACPALRGKICAACCGEHRLVAIPCPADCVYLASNEDYQRHRAIGRAPAAWVERLLVYDERGGVAQAVVHEVQLALCLYSLDRRDLDRTEALEGLEFARRRMSPIQTPEPYRPRLGELLVEQLDRLIEAKALLERERVREVLDELHRHLERDVTPAAFPDFLRFLRSLYSDLLAPGGGVGRGGGSSRIVAG